MRHKKKLLALLGGLLVGAVTTAWCHWTVSRESAHTYHSVAEVPRNHVGLVLGCSERGRDGGANPFFQKRMQAAADLFHAGKVDYLLVSGDNHRAGYDEPTDMKQALLLLGVPAERIVCDYAGFTTLDSVVRCKEVFQQTAVTIVSQQFHNERAIYLARAHGLEAIGFNADAVSVQRGLRTYVREAASRVKAVWDVHLSGRQPKFLGPPITIGGV
jgi:SanA protein